MLVLGTIVMIVGCALDRAMREKDSSVSHEIDKYRDQRAVNRGRRARLEREAREANAE